MINSKWVRCVWIPEARIFPAVPIASAPKMVGMWFAFISMRQSGMRMSAEYAKGERNEEEMAKLIAGSVRYGQFRSSYVTGG